MSKQPTYVGRDGREHNAYNTLDPQRELELRRHLEGCDVALQQCQECWLLYVSIGQHAYVEALTEGMDADS